MAQPMNAGAAPTAGMTTRASSPTYQAYQMLHVIFTLAPIITGLDKFFHLLVNWDQYLAPVFARLLGGHTFMLVVGVIEIIAGLIVAFRPRIGGYIVTLWLWGIILNLLLNPIVYDAAQRTWGLDIALRDLGLSIGALALARLSAQFERR
jgi:hypothetical protein